MTCGVIMPISAIDGCSESHWGDVLQILSEAIESCDFEPMLVSDGADVGIIHKRIIQNLYDNPVVVCDVSGKNPNVMFELGMRLAFDKPTIIVRDDKTSYSFDTSPIEHLEYPRDLRFSRIVEFKKKLAEKILATHLKATTDASYTTFLKHFGEFKVAKLEKKEVPGQEFILDELRNMRLAISRMEAGAARENDSSRPRAVSNRPVVDICTEGWPAKQIESLFSRAKEDTLVVSVERREVGEHIHVRIVGRVGSTLEPYKAYSRNASHMRDVKSEEK